MTAALFCALVVAMTFIPLLGYYIQRPPAKRKSPRSRRSASDGFYGFYNRLVGWAIQHRWTVLSASSVFLVVGAFVASQLKTQFFPEDVQYWFYLDIWLPNDVPLSATNDATSESRSSGTASYSGAEPARPEVRQQRKTF